MAKGHKDKVAVITGAAERHRPGVRKRLAEDGVHIAIADIGPADQTVKMVEQAGRQALACQCDVTSPESVAAMAARGAEEFGRCDIVINCAGIFPQRAFDDMTFEDWRQRAVDKSRQRVPGDLGVRAGHEPARLGPLVNMASSTVGSVVTGFVHYVTSKGGIVGFTRALASELGPHGITVNAIAPGLTRDAGRDGAQAARGHGQHGRGVRCRSAQMQAIKRAEVPDDLVGTVSFLTSDDAGFITGQTLNVDGGRVRS